MSSVLIVEDDDVIAGAIASHLTQAGFDPLCVDKGDVALARLRYERPEVCVLDLMLPGLDGWQLIRTARAEGIGTPIIVVSARGTEQDRIVALDLGADEMQGIWGRRQRYRDRIVDVFVRRLRHKIDRRAPRHEFIHTRRGVGYKLEPQPK